MILEDITLGEMSQTEKDTRCMISPIRGIPKKAEFIETESRVVVRNGKGVGEMGRVGLKVQASS